MREEEEVIKVGEEGAVVEVVDRASAILSRKVNAPEALHADSHTKELEVRHLGLSPSLVWTAELSGYQSCNCILVS